MYMLTLTLVIIVGVTITLHQCVPMFIFNVVVAGFLLINQRSAVRHDTGNAFAW